MLQKLSTCSFFILFTESPVRLVVSNIITLFYFIENNLLIFPLRNIPQNMFSPHSTPRISHNTLNSRDGSKYSIVFT